MRDFRLLTEREALIAANPIVSIQFPRATAITDTQKTMEEAPIENTESAADALGLTDIKAIADAEKGTDPLRADYRGCCIVRGSEKDTAFQRPTWAGGSRPM